jgi:small subunit ribosomal protein S3
MGQLTTTTGLHLTQNKTSNSFWYADYYLFRFVFRDDIIIYSYLRSYSSIKYNILKRDFLYKIEISQFCVYRVKKLIILSLQLIYLKRQISKKQLHFFVINLLTNIKKIISVTKNFFLISYKVGRQNAKFFALRISSLLEKRIKFRSKTVKNLLTKTRFLGIRVRCKGRLNFVDRARQDQLVVGSVPLQTFNANIDYGLAIANTKKGLQSIKVWIFTNLNKKNK